MQQQALRTLHIELRLGDVLTLANGVSMQLQFKKGQTARLCVRMPADLQIKKTSGAADKAAPSPAN